MANEQTIDELNIKINAEAKQSSSGLDKLVASIEKLKAVTGGGISNLSGISASIQKLTGFLSNMKSQSGIVSSLARSIDKLNSVKTDRISGNIKTLTSSLKTLGGMDPSLKSIISDLASLTKQGGGSTAMSALKLQAQVAKTQATIDKSALTSAKAQQGLQAIAEKNRQIEETARAAAMEEQELGDSINRAVQQHIAQYGSAGAFSNKVTDLGAVMPDYGTEQVVWPQNSPSEINANSINELKKSLGDVGSTASAAMNEVSSGSSKATGFVNRLKQSVSSAKEQLSGIGSSSRRFFSMGRLYGWYFILRQIGNIFSGWISNINSYIENMNLFDVAMGKSAESGEKLANSLQSVLGIDAGEAMRYMGVFQQMTTSFGIANKQATTMSENLTQLGYDMASFYNISTTTAFTKLQSGLSGQTAAMRQLGIDTSKARLQQELYNLGINQKVTNLTQADKATLRYIAIMKQTTNAQGDMARTIQTPANALRVLQAQLSITGRAIGSIFIPALEAIIPPVTAVIEVIGELASELASLLGFKMPKIDYSSLNTGLSGISDNADSASNSLGSVGDSASKTGKKLKDTKKDLDNLISGFDELHIIQNDNSNSDTGTGSSGSGTGTGGNILSGVDLPSYNALKDAISNNIDALKKKILDFIDAFKADPLTTFADALWGVGGAFNELGKWLSNMDYADILMGISTALMAYGLTKNPVLAIAIGAITMALSRLLPEKQKIDLLNGTLAVLGGALMLKTFTGMKWKLALAVSALVTSGLIELLGKENAINLLASSLTGLGAGVMAFTFTGNLPLAIAIGAISTAISGLAIHFSDLQIAPALLAGVSSALLAFRFGGFSAGSAGIIGLGVAITSFAELNDIAPGLRDALLGLAGAITGVGLAIKLGFGVEGTIITAVALAFVGLGTGLIQASKDAQKADLEKRFGSIKLSAQECEDVAERLTKTPWTVKIDAAIDANDKLKDLEKNIESDVNTLNKLNWKVSIGMKLTKGETNDYKDTIKSFISDAKAYVQQQQYSVTLAINASYEPGSNTAKNLEKFVNTYYGNAQKQLDSLGKQLSDEVNKAFSDGILTEGEYLKISNIEQKMQKIIDKISDAEYKAKLDNLTADVSEKGLTADSFKDLQTQIQKSAQDRLSKADQVRLKAKATAELKLSEDGNKAEYTKAVQEAQEYYDQQKATIDLTGLNVSLKTMNSKFSSELKIAEPVWAMGVKDSFKHGFTLGLSNPDDLYKEPVWKVINGLSGTYQYEINNNLNIAPAARKNIKELVSQLQPTEDDLKQIAESAKKAGKAVPENVSEGISNIEQMKAIGQNMDSINYMVGVKLSTDPKFLNTLATSKDAGKDIDSNVAQGLTDNLQFVKDSATGTITGIKDSVTGKVTEITPTLKENLQSLGLNMSNSLVSGTENKSKNGQTASTAAGAKMATDTASGAKGKENDLKKQMGDIGTNAAGALSSSAQKKVNGDKPLWMKMFGWLPQWAKEKLGIHSPSTVFSDIGDNIIKGLWNGIDGNVGWLKNKIQDFCGGIIDTFKKHFKIHSPSQVFADVIGKNLALGLGQGFTNSMKSVSKLMVNAVPTSFDYQSTSENDLLSVNDNDSSASLVTPEIVVSQPIIGKTVTEGNEGLATAIIAAAEQIVEAIEKKDTTVKVDDKVLAKTVNKTNAGRGYNLGLQST